jgi:hypothetical protein
MKPLDATLVAGSICLLYLTVRCSVYVYESRLACDAMDNAVVGGGVGQVLEGSETSNFNVTPGVFTFTTEDVPPTNMMITAQITPAGAGDMTSMMIDLTDAFRRNMGNYKITLPSTTKYNVKLVNGNLANPLFLHGVTTGGYHFSNENTITNIQTGVTYSLKSARTAVTAQINGERQKTIAFTAAYNACPQVEPRLMNMSVANSTEKQAPVPSIRDFMDKTVQVGGL